MQRAVRSIESSSSSSSSSSSRHHISVAGDDAICVCYRGAVGNSIGDIEIGDSMNYKTK